MSIRCSSLGWKSKDIVLASLFFVIPALGAGIHALRSAPKEGVDPVTKSRDDG
jgi:hypothetical protein